MDDADIRASVYAALAVYAEAEVFAEVKDGVVTLVGEANAEEERQAIERDVRAVPGVREVRNELRIEFNAPEGVYPRGNIEEEVDEEARSEIVYEGTEYDFNDPRGTVDAMESSAEAEPFFPPTDVVIRPAREIDEGFEVVGGFSSTSMDELSDSASSVSAARRGDEAIADDVRRELVEDSATTDLNLRVIVRNGIVYLRGTVSSLDDVEAAEDVASRVPGVTEVREHLVIAA
jgi:osmotically-inducible protein OsmY